METVTRRIRAFSLALLPSAIGLLALSVLVAQFKELGTNQEILPLSSFVVLISLSALAFNWCRVSSSFAPENLLKTVYRAGIDLFLASLLALVTTAVAFVITLVPTLPAWTQVALFTLHWLFLFLALFLFVVSAWSLVSIAKRLQNGRG